MRDAEAPGSLRRHRSPGYRRRRRGEGISVARETWHVLRDWALVRVNVARTAREIPTMWCSKTIIWDSDIISKGWGVYSPESF